MQYEHFHEHDSLITVVRNDRREIFAIYRLIHEILLVHFAGFDLVGDDDVRFHRFFEG